MNLDDEVCLCFHVSKRKVINHLRVHRPRRASQLADCYGAGTGCGWCRRALARYFERAQAGLDPASDDLSLVEHTQGRAAYIRAGGGTPPPGATPIDEAPTG